MPPGPAMVFVPGLGLGERAWRPTIQALRSHGHCDLSVFPLPGYGVPTRGVSDLSPAGLARILVDHLLTRAGTHVLVGHSASCQVVAHAAALAPALVEGLVLVGPTTDPRARTWPRLAARWLATARHEDPRQVPVLVQQYRRTGLPGMARAMAAARHDAISDTLRRLSCPVLTLRGAHDRICPEDWARRLAGSRYSAGGFAGSTTLAAGGHMVPLTHGALVAAAVAHWV